MHTEFQEKYTRLGDMVPGDIAVSKDRKCFFVCSYHYNFLKKGNEYAITDVNNLYNQSPDNRDMNQPVKILKQGDKFTCTI
ncbi:MAG: hypothetical protein COA47_10205 [Robiginitomaculum sp.]|nr:MAG: hypothetical protein COA47_10205 [Robiginitomaculum sp.]